MEETVKKLNNIFQGKEVRVTSTNTDGNDRWANWTRTGKCREFQTNGTTEVCAYVHDIGLITITPETITENSVEGDIVCQIKLRRKVELI